MTLRLITIPMSHYCDKARWALERCGHRYVEEAHVQIFHYAATLAARAGLYVPVLVTDRDTIRGSAAISRWADAGREAARPSLYPRTHRTHIEAFEEQLDEGLGVPSRLLMYHHTFQDVDRLIPYALAGAPAFQRWITPKFVSVAAAYIRRRLGVSADSARAARDTCARVLDDVARRLGDGTYLFGDTFSAADLTFASLASPLVLPRQYGIPLPSVAELPPAYAAIVEEFRVHPAGEYALRLYEQHRRATFSGGVA